VRRLERGMKPVTVGLLVLLAMTAITAAAFYKRNPFADRFTIRAAFTTANDVRPGSPVRIAGIEVGRVRSVEFGEGDEAIVKMELRKRGLPVHRNATFKVRPRIFLEGNYFVDLQPGTPDAGELPEDELVPATQTSGPVQFGQVLEMLNTDTREDLRRVIQNLGDAFDKGGADAFNRTTRWWAPAYRYSAIANDAARGQTGRDLPGYLRGASRFAEGLDRDPQALKDLIRDLAATMQAFASEQENLSQTIAELPPFLRQGNRTFAALNTAFPPLRRLVAEMRPTIRESGPTLDAQLPLVRQLRGLVSEPELRGLSRDLRATVPSLAALARETPALGEQQRLLSSCQAEVIIPWQEDKIEDPNFPATGKVYQEGVKWLPGIASESRSFDANGQYVRSLAKPPRFATPLGEGRFLITGDPIGGVNPPPMRQPPLNRDAPCETQERPDLRTKIAAPPQAIRINNNSPAARTRQAKANERLFEFLGEQIKRERLPLELSDKPLTRSEAERVIKEVRGR
jgi:phospholipid/cholesterol/gamma-HCH transport system substrate-binding protein